MHLDPMQVSVVDGAMAEGRQIEIRTELAIQNAQHVEVELCRNPGLVVVRCLDSCNIFPKVHTK